MDHYSDSDEHFNVKETDFTITNADYKTESIQQNRYDYQRTDFNQHSSFGKYSDQGGEGGKYSEDQNYFHSKMGFPVGNFFAGEKFIYRKRN